jgi:predicted small lipoprotein YifL
MLACAVLVTACGQKGPLYLPKAKPVNGAASTAATAATASEATAASAPHAASAAASASQR